MQITALVSIVALLGAFAEAHASPRDHRAMARAHAARAAQPVEGVRRSKRDPNLFIRTDKSGRQCKVRPTKSDAEIPSVDGPGNGNQLVADATTIAAAPEQTTGAQAEVPPPAQDSASAAPSDGASSSAEAAPTSSSAPAPLPTAGGSTGGPLGCKAGVSSGNMLEKFGTKICWWHDWGSVGSEKNPEHLTYIPTLWGNGHKGDQDIGGGYADQTDAARLHKFENMVNGILYNGQPVPKYVAGFNEPDCEGRFSANLSPEDARSTWDRLIKPLGERGAQLISPAPCRQETEDWLVKFRGSEGGAQTHWDITNVHIYKKTAAEAMMVVKHYWETYNKPMIITELGCVDDKNNFTPVQDRGVVYSFIKELIPQLEAHEGVVGYAFSEGNLGDVWKIMEGNDLSETARVYLEVVGNYN